LISAVRYNSGDVEGIRTCVMQGLLSDTPLHPDLGSCAMQAQANLGTATCAMQVRVISRDRRFPIPRRKGAESLSAMTRDVFPPFGHLER
jgi:hypothetical protein